MVTLNQERVIENNKRQTVISVRCYVMFWAAVLRHDVCKQRGGR